ncbi:MAG: hypothetical protein K0S37_772 [Microbacterium sp.]|jgi:hypothetical protein|nr:hypothetical protein [Microbacterium sp.]
MSGARGFAYDRLTEADDQHVEAVRDRLYAAPCGMGVWVSVKTGTIVHGNGGNEREQWAWQAVGPWIKLDHRQIEWSEFGRTRRERDDAREQLAVLRHTLRSLAEPAGEESR